jgi:shikimate dehydrogenase
VRRERLRLAVLGDPLAYTASPLLHRAGLAALGLAGQSSALRTPPDRLGARLKELADAGFRGVNLTAPLKAVALAHVGRLTERARRARSVNTVGFDASGSWGDTTDGPGFVDLLRWLGRVPDAQRAVFLGAGGAARSLALAMLEEGGADLVVSARRQAAAEEEWRDLGSRVVIWRSAGEAEALERATLVVHATPLDGEEAPAPLDRIPASALVVDLRYGPEPTAWVRAARARGFHAWDGLGLLVFQARRSIGLWTGREVPLDPLARAVGWPR